MSDDAIVTRIIIFGFLGRVVVKNSLPFNANRKTVLVDQLREVGDGGIEFKPKLKLGGEVFEIVTNFLNSHAMGSDFMLETERANYLVLVKF